MSKKQKPIKRIKYSFLENYSIISELCKFIRKLGFEIEIAPKSKKNNQRQIKIYKSESAQN